MKKLFFFMAVATLILNTGCDKTIIKPPPPTSTSCTECPTITSVSPSISFSGDLVQIVGTKFKGAQTVYFDDKSVSPISISAAGDTITVEVPQPSASKEKDTVTVSVLVSNPSKPAEILNSNVKGKFKYAEIVTEEFAGKLGIEGGASLVNIDRKLARFYKPRKIVIDNIGNLYVMGYYEINKIDIKTGLVNTIFSKNSTYDVAFFDDIEIASNNILYVNIFAINRGNNNYYSRIEKHLPVTNTSSYYFSTDPNKQEFVQDMEFFNSELYYISRYEPSGTQSVKKIGSNTELISFIQPYTTNVIRCLKIVNTDIQILADSKNIFQYNTFKNPQPLLENNFPISTPSGPSQWGQINIDKNRNVHYMNGDQWIIKSLNKADKKAIYNTLPTNEAEQITPDNLGNYYVADTRNHRILKVSLK